MLTFVSFTFLVVIASDFAVCQQNVNKYFHPKYSKVVQEYKPSNYETAGIPDAAAVGYSKVAVTTNKKKSSLNKNAPIEKLTNAFTKNSQSSSTNVNDKQDIGNILAAYVPPNLTPIHHTRPFRFLELLSGNITDIDSILTPNAIYDTLTDILGVIGIRDLRDWLGLVLMGIYLGPVLIPLTFFPLAIIVLGALSLPIIYNNPPSGDHILARPLELEAPEEAEGHRRRSMDASTDRCMDMFKCELWAFWDDWTADPYDITTTERNGTSTSASQKGRNKTAQSTRSEASRKTCIQYQCSLLLPVQDFFRKNYVTLFGTTDS